MTPPGDASYIVQCVNDLEHEPTEEYLIPHAELNVSEEIDPSSFVVCRTDWMQFWLCYCMSAKAYRPEISAIKYFREVDRNSGLPMEQFS